MHDGEAMEPAELNTHQELSSALTRIVRALCDVEKCALTGINPHIARTVVHMGLDLNNIVAHRSLRDALVQYVSQQA